MGDDRIPNQFSDAVDEETRRRRELRERHGGGFEGYDMPEKEYRAEVNYLSVIAVNVFHSDRGPFLKKMADAWLAADPSNKRIIRQAWAAIVVKYGLEAELDV